MADEKVPQQTPGDWWIANPSEGTAPGIAHSCAWRGQVEAFHRMLPLCPDHRDKQHGKDCLACTIESLDRRLAAAEQERDHARALAADAGREVMTLGHDLDMAYAALTEAQQRLDSPGESR